MSTQASPWWTSLSQVDRSLGGHHFLRLTNTDVYRKRMHQLFWFMTLNCIFRAKIFCVQVCMTLVKAA